MNLKDFDPSKIDLEAQRLDISRADCEESLYVFLRSAWHIFDPSPWIDGWAVEAMAEHLQAVVDGEIKRLIINIPPRCSKSALCSVVFPAWVWAQQKHSHTSGPGVSFLYASFKDSLALRDSRACRKVIQSNWYQERWGGRFQLEDDQNTKERFTNSAGGFRLITSIEAKGATGDGASILIIDDGNSAKEVESDAVVESTNDWLDGTVGTRLNSQKLGAIIEIQQRLGEKDITGHLLEKDKGRGAWTTVVLPMRFEMWRKEYVSPIGWRDPRTREGELLWPERFGEEEVSALEDWMGQWRAAGQLQQTPQPKGGGIIKDSWWKLWEKDAYPPMDFILGSLDTAYTLKDVNDYSALTIWGIFSPALLDQANIILDPYGKPIRSGLAAIEGSPKVMFMYCWQERLEFHQLVERVAETCTRFKVDLLLIENKAAGISAAQELRRLYSAESFGVQLCDPKSQDKMSRLYSIQHLFQEGIVWAPDRKWSQEAIVQVSQFPHGRHDDITDTVSQAMRYLRESGLIARAPEVAAEVESQKSYQGHQQPLYSV